MIFTRVSFCVCTWKTIVDFRFVRFVIYYDLWRRKSKIFMRVFHRFIHLPKKRKCRKWKRNRFETYRSKPTSNEKRFLFDSRANWNSNFYVEPPTSLTIGECWKGESVKGRKKTNRNTKKIINLILFSNCSTDRIATSFQLEIQMLFSLYCCLSASVVVVIRHNEKRMRTRDAWFSSSLPIAECFWCCRCCCVRQVGEKLHSKLFNVIISTPHRP